VVNPATGAGLGEVPELTEPQIHEAITSAHFAFSSWRTLAATQRANFLRRVSELLTRDQEICARLITEEQGKPLKEARGEVLYAAQYFLWFAEEARRIQGEILSADEPGKRIIVLKQPIGVVAAITPWNFPLAMLARKMAAALAAGCTFIAKPAPETPFSALLLAKLVAEAQVPAGVVNIVTGDAETIGDILMTSPLVRKISFTGSTEVGKLLIEKSATTVKKLTLELGGNAPCVIFDDANLDRAIGGALFGKYRNAGQTCICVNRFLVHESIVQRFATLLTERSKSLIVGNGLDAHTDIGPLISRDAVAKVERLVTDAIQKGAHMILGDRNKFSSELFVSPIVLTGVTPQMDLWSEEIFGPVCAISVFKNESEAIALANDSRHGLAAYVYSNDYRRACRVAESLEYGMVGVNDTVISNVQAPFGGVKESGFGREGGTHGIDEYLYLQYLLVNETD
jgi:succinate-semialdehyde dehydrogenase/glutarate-semialdehyde dehydrogenase